MDFEKLATIMCWDLNGGRTAQQAFEQECRDFGAVPADEIVDVVFAGGLEQYAEGIEADTQQGLCDSLIRICNLTIISQCFRDKKKRETFPPMYNFFTYVNNLQKSGRLYKEVASIAETVFNGVIAQRNLKRGCEAMFHVEQSPDLYEIAYNRLHDIWGFNAYDLEALRYFVCQCKALGQFNPSLNKSLYIWGEKKKTGKTTFARALATCLNGDVFDNFGKYESNFATENQFNDHDLPRACVYNCIILDEAMPRDTKKSYGTLKTLITSNSVNYNPKFRQVITLPARRNYIFTSNDDIADYVQDESERRFYAIHFENEPKQLSFDKIYEAVKDFVQQCTPREEMSTQKWYDCFGSVDGIQRKEIEALKNEFIINSGYFEGTATTALNVARTFYKGEPNREQRKAVEKAMQEMFGDLVYSSNTLMYKCGLIRNRVQALKNQALNNTELPTVCQF